MFTVNVQENINTHKNMFRKKQNNMQHYQLYMKKYIFCKIDISILYFDKMHSYILLNADIPESIVEYL